MKSNSLVVKIIFLTLLGLNFSCSKNGETIDREFPRVSTYNVTNITSNGAIFSGEVYILSNEEIIDHGFDWSTYTDSSIDLSERAYLGSMNGKGSFSHSLVKNLIKGKTYYVRAFAKTNSFFVFGDEKKFKYE